LYNLPGFIKETKYAATNLKGFKVNTILIAKILLIVANAKK
jgi:hypothetical protein